MTNEQLNLLADKLYNDLIFTRSQEEKEEIIKRVRSDIGIYEQMVKVDIGMKKFADELLFKSLLRSLFGAKGELQQI
jgi:hypothetical protein